MIAWKLGIFVKVSLRVVSCNPSRALRLDPYQVPIHGLTLEPHGHDSHPRPHTQLLPLFSLAKTSIKYVV